MTSDLLRLHGDPSRRWVDWVQVLREHGHSAPPDEVLDFLALVSTKQARLPLRRGGMGLPAAAEVSAPAYVGGMAMTAQFLARDTPTRLPWSGEQYATHLASEEFPHCVQLQHAWADCATLIAQPERRSSAPPKTDPGLS